MRRHVVLWEAQVRRFLDAFERHKRGHLTAEEAGELLGLHEYPDGRLAIFDGPRCLVRFDAQGVPIDEPAACTA